MVIDWSKIFKNYKGLWIGLKNDEKTVIASGKTVQEVMSKAKEKGHSLPILFRVPTRTMPYIGSF